MPDEYIEVKTRIPTDLHERFIRVMPIYGSLGFVIRTTLEEFCELAESQPSVADNVAAAVRQASLKGGFLA